MATNKTVLVTGSFGLVGSAAVKSFLEKGYDVVGIDNNQREVFFGKSGSSINVPINYPAKGTTHEYVDIRHRVAMDRIVQVYRPSVIIHAAAQPSHDKAAEIPFDDFEINAVGTLNLLEAARRHTKESVFIFMSTNKVYGDLWNRKTIEKHNRFDFDHLSGYSPKGIDEHFPVDRTMHSLFGVSKLSADLMVQEYGRYFGMYTVCLRAGCITGPNHAAVESHGFLSYLVKANLTSTLYTIYGYRGKQVRDNLHSDDLCNLFHEIVNDPVLKGGVFNVGGGYHNSCSILEAIEAVFDITQIPPLTTYGTHRKGDHLVYYTDLTKVQEAYPNWKITRDLPMIYSELVESWKTRLAAGAAK